MSTPATDPVALDRPATGPGADCDWCGDTIPPVAESGRATRRDAETCGKPCRQARHRFKIGRAQLEATDGPMRFAYADPPYPGLARKYYDCPEIDHTNLVHRLMTNYDGWALSTSAAALTGAPPQSVGVPAGGVIELCPPGARVAVWVKGARKVKALTALNAWEPVIVVGGRQRREAVVEDLSDVLIWGGRQHTHPGALVGMKPAAFCEWLFKLLGATRGDTLDNPFVGSGAVERAWRLYTSRGSRGDLPSRLTGAQRRVVADGDRDG